MTRPTLGIQLYTLRDFCRTPEDFDSTLVRLAAMGVQTVQFSAVGDFPAKTQREILDRYGIACCVTHKGLDLYRDRLDDLIADHKALGCPAAGLGWAPEECRDTFAHAADFVKEISGIAHTLSKAGMTFHYHNHDFEFEPLPGGDGRSFYDLLVDGTDPKEVFFIPDVMWMHFAGQDPGAWLRKLAGRVRVLHFKDYVREGEKGRRFVSLGQGVVDLPALYRIAAETRIPYIVYEQDDSFTDGDAFKATEESWGFLQGLQK